MNKFLFAARYFDGLPCLNIQLNFVYDYKEVRLVYLVRAHCNFDVLATDQLMPGENRIKQRKKQGQVKENCNKISLHMMQQNYFEVTRLSRKDGAKCVSGY